MPTDLPGGPSEAATENARRKIAATHAGRATPRPAALIAEAAMAAAHDPALGTDRSVNLGAVTTWLWTSAPGMDAWQREEISDAVAREFGGGSDAD